jgi:hypothetical protein
MLLMLLRLRKPIPKIPISLAKLDTSMSRDCKVTMPQLRSSITLASVSLSRESTLPLFTVESDTCAPRMFLANDYKDDLS